jgi:hypothetical membrane protein
MVSDSPASTCSLHRSSRNYFTQVALGLGMAVPFLYYGIQIVAAPFFPDYSFMSHTASLLGSGYSTHPAVFNAGVIATGIATLFAAFGFFVAFQRIGANRIFTWITTVALIGNAVASLWAGYFPQPDPRHSGHPALFVAIILLPFLLTATLWKQRNARLLKTYLVATIVLLVVMIPIMSGLTGLDRRPYSGLLQRIFALTVFPPIAVCAYFLARRIRNTYYLDPAKPGVED